MNFIHNFRLNGRQGAISLDAYHTNFKIRQWLTWDLSPQKINFYNLNGKSYSNSLQAELNYELLRKFDVRLAYRWLRCSDHLSWQLMESLL